VGGIHLATWLECSEAGAMVVAGSVLFALAWVFSPSQGLLLRWFGRKLEELDAEAIERLAKEA
jgi:manganese/zinc/iron transport system permease protein